ncbi:zinc finger CCCH domain-containing protein 18 [Rhodotorula toruloides]|uniref:Zinc finger CCCH domain-containing protein 18 n=1 Tax=Rhodotorula toruloides TaxID=5286 RepID=A0A511KI12_RHOTO|nr:zinc finger CCCH domain-containing protein 18 [Rhodotorula toruloides]
MSADLRRTTRTRAIRARSAPALPSSLSPVTEVTMGQSSAPLPSAEGSNDRRPSRRSRESSAVRLLVPVLEYRDHFSDALPIVVESPGTPFTTASPSSSSRPALQAHRQRRHTDPSPASWMPSSHSDEALATLEPPPPDYDELFTPSSSSADSPRSASPVPPPGPPSYTAAVQGAAGRDWSRMEQGRRGAGSPGSTAEEGQKRSMVKRFVRWLVVDDKRPSPAQQPWTGYSSLFG